MKRVRSEATDFTRQSLYKRAIMLAIGANALLAISKGLVAWISGSSAVFSDAANSLSDTLYSVLMGFGLYVSQQPADENHPQGHSRFEPFVSLFIALTMTIAGVTAFWNGIQRFLAGAIAIEPGWPTVVLPGAALVKLGMYLVVRRIGQQTHSPAINASARDNLADILTSSAALLGVWGSQFLHPLADPFAGLVVASWIFHSVWEIIRENIRYLTGWGAPPELSQAIADAASTVEGVQNVHRVIADYVGPQLRVDMHINVDGSMTLDRAHDISEQVRARVEALPEIDMAFIHVEPINKRG
ncbi:MAG: cation diffusion facilitator family transporter [Candidatus Vecturithrix sp.]|nr:cation diffusion facilitator family transporter [Candidatus Vecturithrix sp.]